MSFASLVIVIVPIVIIVALTVGGNSESLRQLRGPMVAAGGLLLLGFVLLVSVYVMGSYFHEHNSFSQFSPLVSLPSQEVREKEPIVTNEQLWNRLTEARIDLHTEQEPLPSDGTETKTDQSNSTAETDSSVDVSELAAPQARPGWVDNPPQPVGKVFRTVLTSDPFSTEDECYEQLENRFFAETTKQLQRIAPPDQQDLVDDDSLARMGITLSYVMKEICRESFTETVDSSVGMMKKVHVLMEFGPGVENHLLTAWSSYQRQFRLTLVAKITALVLATLAAVYGLLQLDTWTRGYYTKRLLVGVPAAIITIAVLLFVV